MLLPWGRAVWGRAAAPLGARWALLLPMSTTTTSTTPHPPPPPLLSATLITYHRAARVLEVELSGQVEGGRTVTEIHRFSAELLRIASPAINNRAWSALRSGDAPSTSGRLPAARKGIGIIKIDPVGNYAVRLTFDDLHNAGIYTWDYLKLLSQNRWAVAREYFAALKARGLARRPPPPTTSGRR
jgi:DUF971 family protein